MGAFLFVLTMGGWSFGSVPDSALLATASGTAFAVIAVTQIANAFACRSQTHPTWRINPLRNRLILVAVAIELALLGLFVGVPGIAGLLGGSWPTASGWAIAGGAGVLLLVVDAAHKWMRGRSSTDRKE